MFKTMKFPVIIGSIIMLFTSCSKPKDLSESYLKGKLDGDLFDCINVKASKPSGSGDPTVFITGISAGHRYELRIEREGTPQEQDITEGTYEFQAVKSRNITIWHNEYDIYFAGSAGGGPLSGAGRITINKIDKNYIKGNLECVTSVNTATGLSKTVTDGEFYIKRSN